VYPSRTYVEALHITYPRSGKREEDKKMSQNILTAEQEEEYPGTCQVVSETAEDSNKKGIKEKAAATSRTQRLKEGESHKKEDGEREPGKHFDEPGTREALCGP